MKLAPINMDYYLFQFHGLNFVLRLRLHGESVPNFNFFNVNLQIWQRNHKVQRSNCLNTNFHISDIIWKLLDEGIITNASF